VSISVCLAGKLPENAAGNEKPRRRRKMNLDVISRPSEVRRGPQNAPVAERRECRRTAPLAPTNRAFPGQKATRKAMEMTASGSSASHGRDRAATAIFHTAGRSLGRWWRTFLEWRRQRKAIAQLERMSDHELKDIGLIRDQIEAGVRGDLERDPTLIRRCVPRRILREVEARVA
jgi:uncharacterized protein YjiS (DUF1127 family)